MVVFEDSEGADEVELIPNCWLLDQEKKCSWPGLKNRWKVTKAIKEMWRLEDTWSVHPIRILGKCCKF